MINKIILIFSYLFYFSIPFLIFKENLIEIGGDDIKFEFYDSSVNIKKILEGSVVNSNLSISSMIHEVSNFGYYLYISLLNLLPFNNQALYYSIHLSLTFFSIYFLLKQTQKIYDDKISFGLLIVISHIYVQSPVFINTLFVTRLPVITYIWGIPLILGLFIKYTRSGRSFWILISGIVLFIQTSIYSSLPWTITLIPLILIYFFLCANINLDRSYKYLTSIILFIMILNLDSIYIMISYGLFSDGMFNNESIISSKHVLLSTSNLNNPFLTISGIPTNQFINHLNDNAKNLFIILSLYIIGVILYCCFILKNSKGTRSCRNMYYSFLINFVIINFFYNGFGGHVKYFALLMEKIPFLIMWRNSYDKFAISQSLSFCILIFVSFTLINKYNENKKKKLS